MNPDHQILPSELLVSSLDGRQLILSSTRLKKRIIPQLTSAHDFSSGLPVYRFLASLARQSTGSYVHWDWPQTALETFFPRVIYKHLVLQKATWQIASDQVMTTIDDEGGLLNAWGSVCEKMGIPRYVQIREGDNTLLIDGQSFFSVQLLAKYLKKHQRLILVEYLPGSETGLLGHSRARIDHEVIFPFLARECQNDLHSALSHALETTQYNLGSEWLYLKIYCSAQASDYLLINYIEPFVKQKLAVSLIDRWFYIRYYDPQHHLRIRIRLKEGQKNWSRLLKQIQTGLKPFLNTGVIKALKTDTYVREIERYFLLPYANLETIFFADSECIAGCLRILSEDGDTDQTHWLLVLRSCDMLMDCFQLTVDEKFQVISGLHAEFSQEFDPDKRGAIMLNHKYRSFKKMILEFLDPGFDERNDIKIFIEYFDHRSSIITAQLQKAYKHTHEELVEFFRNLLHLSLNRWFNNEQRRQEWAIYHFLKKYYDTKRKIS